MELFFYLFASLIVISSLLVVISRNPVHSVLWLIFAFCNASGLMVLLGAEFLAMMLIVIYVGAVAVLFLFVVMMLDIHFAEAKAQIRQNITFSVVISCLMFADFVVIILLGMKFIDVNKGGKAFAVPSNISNSHAIGEILYTDFILPFQTSGIILFVAMVACISLTLRHRTGVKKQDVARQLARNKRNSLFLERPATGSGIAGLKYDE